MSAIETYISFLLTSIVSDMSWFRFHPWLTWTLIPAIFYIWLLLIKYLLLTIPVWLPFAIIGQNLKGIFYYNNVVKSKK